MTHVEDLVAFVRGELGDAETAAAREHVSACDACRSEVEALNAAFGMLESTSIDAPTNFARVTALRAAREARTPVRRGLWDRVAAIVTTPVFGYPAWALSAAAHLIALGVMTFVMVERSEKKISDAETPRFALAEPPKSWTSRPIDTGAPVAPPSSEFAAFLADRSDDASRAALLRAHNSLDTAAAVDSALGWLASRQQNDGSWPVDGGLPEYRTGVTAVSTLAFLAHGDSHATGRHRETVGRALEWLRAGQSRNGRFGPEHGSALPQHAAATLAFAEAFAMTGDASLRQTLVAAVEHLAASRSPRGGWGSSLGSTPDAVTTAWSMAALRIADAAGIESARSPLAGAAAYLDALTGEDGRTGLRESGAHPNGWETPTAAALFARRWTGLGPEAAARRAALLATPDAQDLAGAAFGALASLGTPSWDAWNASLKAALLPRQNADGSFQGDRLAGYGGSVYATAMAALALQACHRYPV
jgi:squalene cyclase